MDYMTSKRKRNKNSNNKDNNSNINLEKGKVDNMERKISFTNINNSCLLIIISLFIAFVTIKNGPQIMIVIPLSMILFSILQIIKEIKKKI